MSEEMGWQPVRIAPANDHGSGQLPGPIWVRNVGKIIRVRPTKAIPDNCHRCGVPGALFYEIHPEDADHLDLDAMFACEHQILAD